MGLGKSIVTALRKWTREEQIKRWAREEVDRLLHSIGKECWVAIERTTGIDRGIPLEGFEVIHNFLCCYFIEQTKILRNYCSYWALNSLENISIESFNLSIYTTLLKTYEEMKTNYYCNPLAQSITHLLYSQVVFMITVIPTDHLISPTEI